MKMATSRAQVLCEYCCKYIRNEIVRCPSPDKPITIKLDICPDCMSQFQRYQDLAHAYAVAHCLGKEGFTDQIMMRDFAQRSVELVKRIKADKKDPRDIFEQHKEELVQLSNRAVEVWNMYTARYQRDFPLLKCLELVKNTENPFLQYQQYIHRKIKNVYG